jgi:hypothetical protein
MSLIQLKHYKKLDYPATSKKTMPPLPKDISSKGRTVVTFRPLIGRIPDISIKKMMYPADLKKMTAVVRFLDYSSEDMLFYGIQTDSPLAPLILWDAAHALPVGKTITIIEDVQAFNYLDREYFSGCFTVQKMNNATVYTKVKQLIAEQDNGLDDWTFGIPVGPEDATLLNKVVKRILELDIPKKEIILCGRPGDNFKYFEQVRIVGEDIKAPPVHITAKKNRIADEAKYGNLCIIHDRVYLPTNFIKAVRRFGDHYPLTAFQSLYFDDKYNFVLRRYSDFGIANKLGSQVIKGLFKDNAVTASSQFSPHVFAVTEKAGFYSANALRYSPYSYPTGSLYLCKRSVWQQVPQDERLYWTEFEDVEQAFRASKQGIPSRINPYAMTQSLIARPLLSLVGKVHYEKCNGGISTYRSLFEKFPLSRKPLLKVSNDTAIIKTQSFIQKYVPQKSILSRHFITSPYRVKQAIDILYRSKIPVQKIAFEQFALDYEKNILFDQLPYLWIKEATIELFGGKSSGLTFLLKSNVIFRNHLAQRPKKAIFYNSLTDYFQTRSIIVKIGSFISAVLLRLHKRKAFYFERSILGLYRDILDTTPFKERP